MWRASNFSCILTNPRPPLCYWCLNLLEITSFRPSTHMNWKICFLTSFKKNLVGKYTPEIKFNWELRIMFAIKSLPLKVKLNPASLEAFCFIFSKILIWFEMVMFSLKLLKKVHTFSPLLKIITVNHWLAIRQAPNIGLALIQLTPRYVRHFIKKKSVFQYLMDLCKTQSDHLHTQTPLLLLQILWYPSLHYS